MEAKEAADLRAEVERLRVQYETEKKESHSKDKTINRLESEIQVLKSQTSTSKVSTPAPIETPKLTHTASKPGVQKKTMKWWQNL